MASVRTRPVAKSSLPVSRSRATFLLGVRNDINKLLLEDEHEEEVGAVFSFTATPAVLPIAPSPVVVNHPMATLPPVYRVASPTVSRSPVQLHACVMS